MRHSATLEIVFCMVSFFAKINIFIFRPKTMDYNYIVHGLTFGSPKKVRRKRISSERASHEEQNGANFSSVAPFSEEL